MITTGSHPRLAAKARLRWDRTTKQYLLLSPERGLLLNQTAAEVLRLCSGEQTVAGVLDVLTGRYPEQQREDLEQDVLAWLHEIARRGLIHDEPSR